MADLAFRSAASASDLSFGSSTVTVGKPSGLAQDDGVLIEVVILTFAPGVPATVSNSDGLTKRADDRIDGIAGGFINARVTLWEKVAGGSEPADYTFTLSTASGWLSTAACWDNALVSGWYGQVGALATGTGTVATANSITTDRTRQLLVYAVCIDSSTTTWTPDAAMTERSDDGGIAIADEQRAAPGATGTRAATASMSSVWFGYLVGFYSEDSRAVRPRTFPLGMNRRMSRRLAGMS